MNLEKKPYIAPQVKRLSIIEVTKNINLKITNNNTGNKKVILLG